MSINEKLLLLKKKGLYRQLHPRVMTGGMYYEEGRRILNFSSNDYLDLASDSRVKKGAIDAINSFHTGATASRLMSGNLRIHEELESELAQLAGKESALVFGSGYLANIGLFSAIAGEKDEIFADRLIHASLIDGIRLSGARFRRYRHNDLNHLEALLKKSACKGTKLIVTDSVFSMDGDIADLKEMETLSRKYDALLVVDEAHAFGIFGGGGGICRIKDNEVAADVVIGTLSKAFAGYGGFIVCSRDLRELLINKARSFIYSTGLPPSCLGSAISAVRIVNENPGLGEKLIAKAHNLSSLLTGYGIEVGNSKSQIIPIHIGENEQALTVSESLSYKGIIATAIRPPTVPPGTARLRLSVTLAHSEADLHFVAEQVHNILSEARMN